MAPRFVLVAGEPSGDQLAAGLITALRRRFPDAVFEGVTGPQMEAAGCQPLASADELGLFGFTEVIAELPRLLALRRRLLRYCIARPPTAFIGIDVPAFNTGLERRLKRAGITTVHYVCPTAWAWREGRTRMIRQAVDVLLAIFPFEPPFFKRHGIEARFVGHPLADRLPQQPDAVQARQALGLAANSPWVGLLPGSRRSEVRLLGPLFLRTATWLAERLPGVRFIAPMATREIRAMFEQQLAACEDAPPIMLVDGQARDVMCAADVLLLASGTATLEALLLKTPMVVAYMLSPGNYAVVRSLNLLKTEFVSMPNLLAGRELVPELLQTAAEPRLLGAWLYRLLVSAAAREMQTGAFAEIHARLALGADENAAAAVAEVVRP